MENISQSCSCDPGYLQTLKVPTMWAYRDARIRFLLGRQKGGDGGRVALHVPKHIPHLVFTASHQREEEPGFRYYIAWPKSFRKCIARCGPGHSFFCLSLIPSTWLSCGIAVSHCQVTGCLPGWIVTPVGLSPWHIYPGPGWRLPYRYNSMITNSTKQMMIKKKTILLARHFSWN